MSDWLKATQDLSALWEDIEALATADTEPLSLEERREIGIDRLAALGYPVETVSPAQLEAQLEAYIPRADTEVQNVTDRIGRRLNAWFRGQHPRVSPLLNPRTRDVEIVVEQGIQALFLMTVSLARNELGAFPRMCTRPNCTRKTFMTGRKKYCSLACQQAHKSARQRQRKSEVTKKS
ncbi:hypothetical protein [Deinococcus aerophilus]|uniref:Zinc finger CGNR domain-containing protein n=1 Tax=Deinococcus aerophilus TaxID=522488 RepID=A0ABQ2H167_9DEIO|nr:hypothetical protein [Deinococcus aerophilus]GGM22340.1 hypothetical protein GCM10010841_32780 [Deinococcus aerophilus]